MGGSSIDVGGTWVSSTLIDAEAPRVRPPTAEVVTVDVVEDTDGTAGGLFGERDHIDIDTELRGDSE